MKDMDIVFHSKPTPKAIYVPSFLWEEKKLVSVTAFELLKLQKWPQVVRRNHIFCEESSPSFVLIMSDSSD